MSKDKEEYVEVTVKLPIQIANYLKAFSEEDLTKAVTFLVVDHVRADVDAATSEIVMEAYGLEPIFKKYGVIK